MHVFVHVYDFVCLSLCICVCLCVCVFLAMITFSTLYTYIGELTVSREEGFELSVEFQDLIRKLCTNSASRLGFEHIKKDDFFAGTDWDHLLDGEWIMMMCFKTYICMYVCIYKF